MMNIFNVKFLGSLVITILYLFRFNYLIISVFSLIYVFVFIQANLNKTRFEILLIELLIYSLPFSFIPILVEVNFVSIFILIQLLIIVSYFLKRKFKSLLYSWSVFLLVVINLLFLIYYGKTGLAEFDTLIKFDLFFLIMLCALGNFTINSKDLIFLKKAYVNSVVIAAFTVFIQYVSYTVYGNSSLGTQSRFGEYRVGFSGVFFDYSIMSIYIISGAFILFFNLINGKRVYNRYSYDIFLIIFFMISSALTSGRSGLVAFVVTNVVYLLISKKIGQLIKFMILSTPLIFVFLYFIELNRASSLTSDAGRFDNFKLAYDFFINNFFFGTGGTGYANKTGNMVPHNLILDLLVTFGFCLTVFILGYFIYLFKKSNKVNKEISFVLILFMIGGMFHASFINTHYITVIGVIIAGVLNNNNNKNYS